MDAEMIKQINSLRFSWHEQVLRDRDARKHPTALIFAGHVMHQFSPAAGYASISLNAAAKALNLDKTSVIGARDYLVKRGWLRVMENNRAGSKDGAPKCYTLSGGPDDLAIDLNKAATVEIPDTAHDGQLTLWQSEAFSKSGVARDT